MTCNFANDDIPMDISKTVFEVVDEICVICEVVDYLCDIVVSDVDEDSGILKMLSGVMHGVAVGHYLKLEYAIRPVAKGSTVFRITKNGRWLLRLDKAHVKGATFPHININPRITGVVDPHTAISGTTLKAGAALNGVVRGAQTVTEKVLVPLAFFIDLGTVANAVYKDCTAEEDVSFKNTTQTVSEIGGRCAGAMVGGHVGASVGATAGMLLGPIGAAVGGLLGGIGGSIGGAIFGSEVAKSAHDTVRANLSKKRTKTAENEISENEKRDSSFGC